MPTAPVVRLRAALASHGLLGSARRGVEILRDWRSLWLQHAVDVAFDRENGVETAGIIPLQALDVSGRWAAQGHRYEATTPVLFHRAFEGLQIDLRRFTFVDIGAGKGRALLLASEYPFCRIVGVEFSRELVAVARRNVARWLEHDRACMDITLMCSDATEYELPPEPLVLYFFNPFEPPVMRSMLDNVVRSFRENPRPLFIVLRGDAMLVAEVLASGFSELDPGHWPKVFSLGASLVSLRQPDRRRRAFNSLGCDA